MLLSIIQELFSLQLMLLVHSWCFYRHVALTVFPLKIFFFTTKSWIASNDVMWPLCDEPERMAEGVLLDVTVQDVINCMQHSGYL